MGCRNNGQEWRYKGVISPFSRLYFILDGQADVQHHDHQYHMTPGTLNLVPCFTLSEYQCASWFRYYYVHFTSRVKGGIDLFNIGNFSYQIHPATHCGQLFERMVQLLPDKDIGECKPHALEQKRDYFEKLNDTAFDESPSVHLEVDGIFRQILAPLLESVDNVSQAPSEQFAKVFDYIEKNLNQPLTLKKLASIAALHPNYFSDQFSRILGVRPIEYINRKRIQQAQILVLTNAGSIKEIAAKTGFSNIAYFSRTFKRYTGTSPSRYFEKMYL